MGLSELKSVMILCPVRQNTSKWVYPTHPLHNVTGQNIGHVLFCRCCVIYLADCSVSVYKAYEGACVDEWREVLVVLPLHFLQVQRTDTTTECVDLFGYWRTSWVIRILFLVACTSWWNKQHVRHDVLCNLQGRNGARRCTTGKFVRRRSTSPSVRVVILVISQRDKRVCNLTW
jgi:hypothetical protein